MDQKTGSKIRIIISMVIFGTIGVFRHYTPLPSSLIAMVRGLIGASFLLLLRLIRRSPSNKQAIRRQLPLLCISGALIGFNWIMLFEAYRYTTVAIATLCYYMAPILVILVSPLLLREKLTVRKLLCVLCALLGMVFVSGVPAGGIPQNGELRGILLGLIAAVIYACVVILNKKFTDLSAFDRTTVQLLSAGLVLIPYVLATEDLSALTMTPLAVTMLLIMGILHTGISYVLYFGSLSVLKAQTAALFSYIDPIVAVLLSALLLREPMGLSQTLGAILVLGATLLSEWPEPKKSA